MYFYLVSKTTNFSETTTPTTIYTSIYYYFKSLVRSVRWLLLKCTHILSLSTTLFSLYFILFGSFSFSFCFVSFHWQFCMNNSTFLLQTFSMSTNRYYMLNYLYRIRWTDLLLEYSYYKRNEREKTVLSCDVFIILFNWLE